MDNRTLVRVGGGGTVVAALCCDTPVLAILLGVVGLSAWVGWLDYVLIPALAVFIGITLYAMRRRRHDAACCVAPGATDARQSRGRS